LQARQQAHGFGFFTAHHVHRFVIFQANPAGMVAHARNAPHWLFQHIRQGEPHHAVREVVDAGRGRQMGHIQQAGLGANHAGRERQVDVAGLDAAIAQRRGDGHAQRILQRVLVAGDGRVAHPHRRAALCQQLAVTPERGSGIGCAHIDGDCVHEIGLA
jgi:hypothetical protein